MAMTGFDIERIGAIAMGQAGNVLAPLGAFSFGVDATKHNGVLVPVVGAIADGTAWVDGANDFLTGNAAGAASTVRIAVDDSSKPSGFILSHDMLSHVGEATLSAMWAEQIKAAVRGAYTKIMGKILYAAFASETVIAAADFDSAQVTEVRTKLEDRLGVGQDARFSLVLSSAYYKNLRLDPDIKTLFASAGVLNPITGASVPMIDNCEIIKSTVPANAENLTGFICDRSAIAVAFATETTGDVEFETIVTDPITGIPVLLHLQRDAANKNYHGTAVVEFGCKAVNALALSAIRSAVRT